MLTYAGIDIAAFLDSDSDDEGDAGPRLTASGAAVHNAFILADQNGWGGS